MLSKEILEERRESRKLTQTAVASKTAHSSTSMAEILTQTVQAQTPTKTWTPTPTVMSTNTAINTPTPKLGPAMFTTNFDSNCRAGPSQIFDIRNLLTVRETFLILGKSSTKWASWWYLEVKPIPCWVSDTVGKTSGNLEVVPIVMAPTIPTPDIYIITFIAEYSSGEITCRNILVYIDGQQEGAGTDTACGIAADGSFNASFSTAIRLEIETGNKAEWSGQISINGMQCASGIISTPGLTCQRP